MFETTPAGSLLDEVIRELDRTIRAAQAEQAAQIGALVDDSLA